MTSNKSREFAVIDHAQETDCGSGAAIVRPVDAFERLFYRYGERNPVHFSIVAEFDVVLGERQVRSALDAVQKRHPLLSVHVQDRPSTRLGTYRAPTATPVPLHVHKQPDLEDVEKAYDLLLGGGYRPENIASVGHSIGGNLAVSLTIRLRDRGAALPAAILSISPWCDLTLATASIDTNADVDMALSRGMLEFFRSAWLDGTGVDWRDPRVNLLAADLRALPPISIFYGSDDLLADEAVQLSRRAKAAGNDQHLRSIQGGQHSFIMGAGRVPEVDDAIAEMGKWLRTKLRLKEAA
jgi:alpha/beta hydrolase family protein